VVTHPRIQRAPTPLLVALDQIEAWLESPTLSLLTESDGHWPELRRLMLAGNIAGPLVHDARIAAICLQHGVRELWTADRDFSRFPQLKTVNPLVR
jgi:predicted nucleic acid-binding protein